VGKGFIQGNPMYISSKVLGISQQGLKSGVGSDYFASLKAIDQSRGLKTLGRSSGDYNTVFRNFFLFGDIADQRLYILKRVSTLVLMR